MSDPGRKPATTLEDVLSVFNDRDDYAEPMTAPEFADRLDCSRRTALNKLHALEDAGNVSSKKVGGRSKVWWVPVLETPRVEDELTSDAVRHEATESTVDTPSIEDPIDDLDSLTTALDTLDAADNRRAAVRACVEYLQEHGTAQKSGFVEDVYPDYNAGYSSTGGWWNKIGKEYLKTVADECDSVEPPKKEGSHIWQWVE